MIKMLRVWITCNGGCKYTTYKDVNVERDTDITLAVKKVQAAQPPGWVDDVCVNCQMRRTERKPVKM